MKDLLAVGTILDDRYELGSASAHEVDGATHAGSDRRHDSGPVRIRLIQPGAGTSESDLATALRHELGLTRTIRAPKAVVIARAAGVVGDVGWRVTEARAGDPLRQLINQRGTMPIAAAVDCALGAARIVAELHEAGIAHLGLSPDTVHLSPGEAPIWIDGERFWRRLDGGADSPFRRAEGGAPEVVAGAAGDCRSDVYDLGRLLLFLMSGESDPNQLADVTATAQATVQSTSMPSRLRQIVAACLATDPERRPKDAGELARDLELVRDELSLAATTTMRPIRRDEVAVDEDLGSQPTVYGGGDTGRTITNPGRGSAKPRPAAELGTKGFGEAQPFEIESVLGRGGMGVVYLARDRKLDRKVAIKLHELGPVGDEDVEESLVREARMMASLPVHPNVVAVFAADELDDGRLYVVMEYIAGGSLRQELKRDPTMTRERFERVARDICGGVAHAHSHKLVHKDIKPENVMVATDGRHKIADFGIAHAMQKTGMMGDSKGTVSGTPAYMSPEQFENQKLTPASDVYAIGCLLYELATGAPPYTGRDVWRQHFFDQPKPPRFRFESPANQEVERIILRCLAKEPKDRYADAAALGEALSLAFRKGLGGGTAGAVATDATIATRATETQRRRDRRLMRAVNTMILVLVVAIAGILVWKGTANDSGDVRLDLRQGERTIDQGSVAVVSLSEIAIAVDGPGRIEKALWRTASGDVELALAKRDSQYHPVDPKESSSSGRLIVRYLDAGGARLERSVDVSAQPYEAPAEWTARLDDAVGPIAADADVTALEERANALSELRTELDAALDGRLWRSHPRRSELLSTITDVDTAIQRRRTAPMIALRVAAQNIDAERKDLEVDELGDVLVVASSPNGDLTINARYCGEKVELAPAGTGELRLIQEPEMQSTGRLEIEAVDRFGNSVTRTLTLRGRPFAIPGDELRRLANAGEAAATGDLNAIETELRALHEELEEARSKRLAKRENDLEPLAAAERAVAAARRLRAARSSPPQMIVRHDAAVVEDGAEIVVRGLPDLTIEVTAPNGLESWSAELDDEPLARGDASMPIALPNPSRARVIARLVLRVRDRLGLEAACAYTIHGRAFEIDEAARAALDAIETAVGKGRIADAAKDLETLRFRLRQELAAHLAADELALSPLDELDRQIMAARERFGRAPTIGGRGPEGPLTGGTIVEVRGLDELVFQFDCPTGLDRATALFRNEALEPAINGSLLRLQNPRTAATDGELVVEVVDKSGRSAQVRLQVIGKPFALDPVDQAEFEAVCADVASKRNLRQAVAKLERIRRDAASRQGTYLARSADDLARIDARLAEARDAVAANSGPGNGGNSGGNSPPTVRAQLSADGDVWQGIRFRRIQAAGKPLFVAESELSWGEFGNWWRANASRYQESVAVGEASLPVTGVGAEALTDFARSIGARLPTADEWTAFSTPASGDFNFRQAYKDERNPNCNSRLFVAQRADEFVSKPLQLRGTKDQLFGGHGSNGGLYHVGGNVSEIVRRGNGFAIMGSNFKSRTLKPLDQSDYRRGNEVGVRLVADG